MKSCVSRSMATSFATKFATGGLCNAWSLTWLKLKSCHMTVINVPLKICFWHCWLLCRWHRVIKMCVNTLGPRQGGRHFPDDNFKCIFLNEDVWIFIKISLNCVSKGPTNNIRALVQIMAWCRPGDKPLSEPMMVSLLTHLCVTRPQWVNHPPSGIKQIMGNCYINHMTLSIDFDIEWQESHHDWSFHAHNEKCVYWCSVNLVNRQISKYPGLFHRGWFIGDCKFIKPFKMRFIWIWQKFRFSDGIQQVEAFHIPGLHVAGLYSWRRTTTGNIRKIAGQSGKTNLPMTSLLLCPNGHTSWGLLKLLSLNSPLWLFWSCRILLYIRLITLIFDR